MTPLEILKNLGACRKAKAWVSEYPNANEQELWEICDQPDWMLWLITEDIYHVPDKLYREMTYEFAVHAIEYAGHAKNQLFDILDALSDYIDDNINYIELKNIYNQSCTSFTPCNDMTQTIYYIIDKISYDSSWKVMENIWRFVDDINKTKSAQADIIRYFIPKLKDVK